MIIDLKFTFFLSLNNKFIPQQLSQHQVTINVNTSIFYEPVYKDLCSWEDGLRFCIMLYDVCSHTCMRACVHGCVVIILEIISIVLNRWNFIVIFRLGNRVKSQDAKSHKQGGWETTVMLFWSEIFWIGYIIMIQSLVPKIWAIVFTLLHEAIAKHQNRHWN